MRSSACIRSPPDRRRGRGRSLGAVPALHPKALEHATRDAPCTRASRRGSTSLVGDVRFGGSCGRGTRSSRTFRPDRSSSRASSRAVPATPTLRDHVNDHERTSSGGELLRDCDGIECAAMAGGLIAPARARASSFTIADLPALRRRPTADLVGLVERELRGEGCGRESIARTARTKGHQSVQSNLSLASRRRGRLPSWACRTWRSEKRHDRPTPHLSGRGSPRAAALKEWSSRAIWPLTGGRKTPSCVCHSSASD